MSVLMRTAVAALLAALLVPNARAQDTPATKNQAPPQKKAARPAGPDPVLATVNNDEIHESEVAGLLSTMSVRPGEEERLYDDVMDTLVTARLLAQFMSKQKITATKEDIQPILDNYEKEARDHKTDLASMLAQNNMSLPELQKRIGASIQWKKFVMQRGTDAELQKYFKKNKDLFDGTQLRASHILISVDPDAPAADKEKAKAKLLAIKKEIDSGKITFADAANKYSEDPSNKETPAGGDLDFFPRSGRLLEEFSAAAFDMKKGAISDPVETKYGYHLIQVTDRQEGSKVAFEQIKDDVMNHYAYDLQKQIAKDLRAKAKIDIKPMPAAFRLRPRPDAATPKATEPAKGASRKDAQPKR